MFIGFRNEDASEIVCKKMNNTYIDTSRIMVEKAKMADDPELQGKAWSKYTKAKVKAMEEQ